MELFKEYKLKNDEIIMFDSISMYQEYNGNPIDIYTSNKFHGAWDKKGHYLTNIHFLNGEASEMDILK